MPKPLTNDLREPIIAYVAGTLQPGLQPAITVSVKAPPPNW